MPAKGPTFNFFGINSQFRVLGVERLRLTLIVSCIALATASRADFQVGDRPLSNIVAPVQLIVVDHERTETLRQQEAARVPAIFLFNTNAAAEAELRMLAAYNAAKEGFLKTVERVYKKRTLAAEAVVQERFGKVVATYYRQNRSFPLTTNLATLWALGESDQSILEELASVLRQTMQLYIRVDTLSAHARLGPRHARLLRVDSTNATLDLDAALSSSIPIYKTNFVTLSRARKNLQATFGPDTQWAGRFLAGFVRENCVCDENLTMQSRARRSDPILAADTYEPGTVIAKAGALIDPRTKAALDELGRRTEAAMLKAQAAEDQRRAEAVAAQLRRDAAEANAQRRQTEERYLGMLVSVVIVACVGMIGLWVAARRRPAPGVDLLVLPTSDFQLTLRPPEIRARLLPELRQWVKRHFLQRLLQSNATLTETQRQAALRVAELEQRLEEIKGPLENKLKVYEQRIAELERELEAKGAENRELLEATIKMARARLEAQRHREGVGWN